MFPFFLLNAFKLFSLFYERKKSKLDVMKEAQISNILSLATVLGAPSYWSGMMTREGLKWSSHTAIEPPSSCCTLAF